MPDRMKIDQYIESLTRIVEARNKKGCCFPDVMPVDFSRLNELRQLLVAIEVLSTLFYKPAGPEDTI